MYVPGKNELRHAARVLARAFRDYPMYVATLPDAKRRSRHLHILFESMVRYCHKHAGLYAASECLEGVMLCLPPAHPEISAFKMLVCGALKIPVRLGLKFVKRQESVDKVMRQMRARHAPARHTYLLAIGVDPASQGQGVGGRLIRQLCSALSAENLEEGIYLETARAENVQIYEHLDFTLQEARAIPRFGITSYAMTWTPPARGDETTGAEVENP